MALLLLLWLLTWVGCLPRNVGPLARVMTWMGTALHQRYTHNRNETPHALGIYTLYLSRGLVAARLDEILLAPYPCRLYVFEKCHPFRKYLETLSKHAVAPSALSVQACV
jgi:hypothetical protein